MYAHCVLLKMMHNKLAFRYSIRLCRTFLHAILNSEILYTPGFLENAMSKTL